MCRTGWLCIPFEMRIGRVANGIIRLSDRVSKVEVAFFVLDGFPGEACSTASRASLPRL